MSCTDPTIYASTDVEGSYAWTDTLRGVHYGPGCVKTALPFLLERVDAKKALIVTGKTLFHKVGHSDSESRYIVTVPFFPI